MQETKEICNVDTHVAAPEANGTERKGKKVIGESSSEVEWNEKEHIMCKTCEILVLCAVGQARQRVYEYTRTEMYH